MSTLQIIGITIAIFFILFIIPFWALKSLDGEGSHCLFFRLFQGFITDIIFGVVGTIGIVIFYAFGRELLSVILPFLGDPTTNEYGWVALGFISFSIVSALYRLFYTIYVTHKYPGFKEFYLNQYKGGNIGKDDFKEYNNKKKQWGIVSFFIPHNINNLKYQYFYDMFGLDASASIDDIKRAYREKAHLYHPDKFSNATEVERKIAEKRFREYKEAYEQILKQKDLN